MSLPCPSRFGHYEIRARLGAGGMGEVYLAEDTRLKRQVAIKILAANSNSAESGRRRLVHEAQAAAALDHPNICSIYEVGELDERAFIVMQYVEGDTLAARLGSGRLTVLEALDVAIQVADGLAEAHARGIVHRDIKPQNIMLTTRGQVKILDFGLAKATGDDAGFAAETHSRLTQAGAIVGTAPYMSPEQVKGQSLDARSDIFSFGTMLYELLSGHNPFSAPTFAETLAAVLTTEPPPLAAHGVTAPADVERVVRHCLRKDREQRYQTMREVRLELESIRRALQSGEARLPDQGAAAQHSDDIPHRDERLGVTSSRPIARRAAIGAAALAAAGYAAWRYNGNASEAGSTSATSPAYDLYLRGKVNVGSENRDSNEMAIKLLLQAVSSDPTFAPAHAELARAYNIKAFYFAPKAEQAQLYEDAEVALQKALRLDPNLAEAHLSRGLLLWTHSNRFPHEQAAQSYKRAITLNPALDEAHHQLAMVYMHIGLLDKAWAQIDRALAINPANTLARFRYGVIDLYRGRYEAALAIFNSTPPQKNPALLSFQQACALFQLNKLQEATAIVDDYLSKNATDEGGTVTSVKAMMLAKAGNATDAERVIQQAVAIGSSFGHFHHTAYNIASAYALLDHAGEALKWLESAADDGFPCYPLFAQDHNLNTLRRDARFVAFLARMKTRMEQYDSTL